MKIQDQEFLHEMVTQLDETIKKLVIEEKEIAAKIGTLRVEELKEFWKQELSEEEEKFFKMTLDYWDKILIRLWARSKRLHHTRAQVGHTLMKSVSANNHNQEHHD
jgi:hypothetical protein